MFNFNLCFDSFFYICYCRTSSLLQNCPQLFLKDLWGCFIIIPEFHQILLYGVIHYSYLQLWPCIWGCSVLRTLCAQAIFIPQMSLVISWRLLCWEWPLLFWTLLSFIRLFPPRFSISRCGKSSKKPTFLLITKYPLCSCPKYIFCWALFFYCSGLKPLSHPLILLFSHPTPIYKYLLFAIFKYIQNVIIFTPSTSAILIQVYHRLPRLS